MPRLNKTPLWRQIRNHLLDVWHSTELTLFIAFIVPGFVSMQIRELVLAHDDSDVPKQLPAVRETGGPDIRNTDRNAPFVRDRMRDSISGGILKNGGRRLEDVTPTLVFTLLNNGQLLTDHVLKNDKPFRNVFPFVADPHQPNEPGHVRSPFFQ